MAHIPTSDLLGLVGKIYDSVLFPENWEPTIAAIQNAFGWHNASLGVYSLTNNGSQFQVALGVPEQYWPVVVDPSYLPDILALWGGKVRIDLAPLEEPILQSHMTDPKTWPDNRYFAAFAVPQGLIEAVSIGLARDSSMVATISGGRHGSRGPITDDELADLRVLAPHLRRAVTIADLFDNLHSRNEMLSSTFESSRAGIILVDERLTILHTNGRAQQMLELGDPIVKVSGRLTLREEMSHNALSAAVGASQVKTGGRSSGIPTRRNDGSLLLVHTFPLKGRAIRNNIAMRATTAVIVASSAGPIDLDSEALALLYDLTPAETRIVGYLVDGLNMSEIAVRLGVAPSTVKTHVLRIYEKTGTHRQAELAALMRSISVPW
jgi:DNA-binding CsgD family transcriptional regulator/PAS domain-containing protein